MKAGTCRVSIVFSLINKPPADTQVFVLRPPASDLWLQIYEDNSPLSPNRLKANI